MWFWLLDWRGCKELGRILDVHSGLNAKSRVDNEE